MRRDGLAGMIAEWVGGQAGGGGSPQILVAKCFSASGCPRVDFRDLCKISCTTAGSRAPWHPSGPSSGPFRFLIIFSLVGRKSITKNSRFFDFFGEEAIFQCKNQFFNGQIAFLLKF